MRATIIDHPIFYAGSGQHERLLAFVHGWIEQSCYYELPPENGHSYESVLHCAENFPFHPLTTKNDTRTTTQTQTVFDDVSYGKLRELLTFGFFKVAPNCHVVLATSKDKVVQNVRSTAIALTSNAEGIGQPGRLKGSTASYDILCTQSDIDNRLALAGNDSGPHNFKERVPMNKAIYAGTRVYGPSGEWMHTFLLQESDGKSSQLMPI